MKRFLSTYFPRSIFATITIAMFLTACNSTIKQEKAQEPSNAVEQRKEVAVEEVVQPEVDPIWMKSDFDSAVAVILNGKREVMRDMTKMDSNYSPGSRRRLNDVQLKLMTDYLSGRKTPQESGPADCFQPYHGFNFYKNGKIAGRLAICFSCRNYFSQPMLSGRISLKEVKAMFAGWNLPTYDWDDPEQSEKAKVKYSDYFNKSVSIIPDDYPVTEKMLRENNKRILLNGSSIDKVCFKNRELRETLLFDLYTDYHRLNIIHFKNQHIPAELLIDLSLYGTTKLATLKQKQEAMLVLTDSAKNIGSAFFKTKELN